jgi:hypothetical protein
MTEDDGCGAADGVEEGLAASVAAGGDAAPVLETGEEVLDPVALPAGFPVVAGGVPAPAPSRDAGGDSLVLEGFAEPVGIAALVGQENSLRVGRHEAVRKATEE